MSMRWNLIVKPALDKGIGRKVGPIYRNWSVPDASTGAGRRPTWKGGISVLERKSPDGPRFLTISPAHSVRGLMPGKLDGASGCHLFPGLSG